MRDLTIEAVCAPETTVNFYKTTRLNITEDCHPHIRRRENLKSHKLNRRYLNDENIYTTSDQVLALTMSSKVDSMLAGQPNFITYLKQADQMSMQKACRVDHSCDREHHRAIFISDSAL
jgi:hypothetical protein